jgi:chemotaxis-related protein WspB
MLLLTLKAGANRYAIDIVRVIELVPRVELRAIPYAPPFLTGLLSYRGKVIPVIDLGLLFDGTSCRDCLSTRIILVNDSPGDQNRGTDQASSSDETLGHSTTNHATELRLLGLIGEEISDLVEVRSEQVVPAPVQLPRAPFLDAIVQTDAGIIQLIAVERIRESFLKDGILEQGTGSSPDPSKAEAGLPALEDSKTHD